MKSAIVEYPCNQGQAEVILLKTMDDLLEYFKIVNSSVENIVNTLVTSDIPKERWDHLSFSGQSASTWSASLARSSITGENPMFGLAFCAQEKFTNMLQHIAKGRTLMVNSNGGYAFDLEIVETFDYEPKELVNHYIENTDCLVLENDPKVDKYTVEYFKNLETKFSYICSLRSYSEARLTAIMKEWRKKCRVNKKIFVYTTGIDSDQMYMYTHCAMRSGIKDLEIQFCVTPEIYQQQYIDWAKDQDINFKYSIV